MPTPPFAIAPAAAPDLDAVRRISAAADLPADMAVIGAVPRPATEDYAPRIAHGEVWILSAGGEAAGVLVLEESDGAALVGSVAVHPDHQGRGLAEIGRRPHPSRPGETLVDMAKRLVPLG